MRENISLNEPHIVLFLTEIQKHGKSIVKLANLYFQVKPHDTKYVMSGKNSQGQWEDILIVSLVEIFEFSFEVLEIDALRELIEDV